MIIRAEICNVFVGLFHAAIYYYKKALEFGPMIPEEPVSRTLDPSLSERTCIWLRPRFHHACAFFFDRFPPKSYTNPLTTVLRPVSRKRRCTVWRFSFITARSLFRYQVSDSDNIAVQFLWNPNRNQNRTDVTRPVNGPSR